MVELRPATARSRPEWWSRASGLPGWLFADRRLRRVVVEVFDRLLRDRGQLLHGARRESLGRNRLAHHQRYRARPDYIVVHWHRLEAAHNRHRHHRHSAFDGHVKRSAQKRLYLPVRRAAAFGKDQQRHAPCTVLLASIRLRSDERAFSRSIGICLSAANAIQERIAEQLLFRHDAKLKRQPMVEHRNVQGRDVIYRVDAGPRGIQALRSHNCQPAARRLRESAPPTPEPASAAGVPARVEQRTEQRRRAEHDRVQINQRIAHQVRSKRGPRRSVCECLPRCLRFVSV